MGLEYLRSFAFMDYAVIGEGDEAFPALLDSLSRRTVTIRAPGVAAFRDGKLIHEGQAPPVTNLDALPTPNYDEYFERARGNQLLQDIALSHASYSLPMESSRGCWWGAKQHCTFCGLNGGSMAYRSKSP